MAIGIIVGASILLLLLIHYFAGRVKSCEVNFLKPNDTYESINYREEGRVSGPYFVWDNGESELEIQFSLVVDYASSKYLGKSFGENVELAVEAIKLPDFINSIEIKTKDGASFSHGFSLKKKIIPQSNGEPALKFLVALEKAVYTEIKHPFLIRFKVKYQFFGTRLLFLRERKWGEKTFTMFAGPELGGLWLAIDPGTTATCIATGSHAENITLQPADTRVQVGETDAITPSMLRINKDYDFVKGQSLFRLGESGIQIGHEVRGTIAQNVEIFQSIKKLLGYKDRRTVMFNNGEELQLNGADLTTLLVQGITSKFKGYIESQSHKFKEVTNAEGKFEPKRLIVAIPNNFTASKIQDLVDCLGRFEQYKEIMCISESEAVLCYYVHQHQKLNKRKTLLEDETVMVFDMGGATINLTVGDAYVTERHGRRHYHIEIDGKMGYSIGGDTIDYCLARLFFEHVDEYPELKPFDPFKDMKSMSPAEREKQKAIRLRVKNVMEKIKLEIIKNLKQDDRKELIKPFDIQNFFDEEFEKDGLSLFIRQESRLYENYFNGSGLKLLSYSPFKELVFQPIEDAIDEMSKVTDLSILDTVILSGRSTLFPGVLATVEQKLKKLTPADRKIRIIPLDKEHAKTAVVRGACWYAANKNAIELSRHKISGQFGIRRRVGAEQNEIDFLRLIPMGALMEEHSIKGLVKTRDNFAFDNKQVQFYQVMCADAKQAFVKGQKHKFSKIGTLEAKFEVVEIGMEILYDDTVRGHIRMSNGKDAFLDRETTIKDLDIADANDEHYTWIVN